MAVYQGARPSGLFGPRIQRRTAHGPVVAEQSVPRRRVSGAIRARRRSNRVGLVLGGIVLAFLLAFFSLAHTMRVSATGYQIDRLASIDCPLAWCHHISSARGRGAVPEAW